MLDLAALGSAFVSVFTSPLTLFFILLGTVMGLVFGSLPGLTATMGVALLIPLTYAMDTATAMGVMLGCYIGGMAGGAISACLLNIPGTPSAVCTSFDGYPMTLQGKGAQALGWAAWGSGFGTLVGWVVLVLVSGVLARFCLAFSSHEYFALALFGLTIIAAVSGNSVWKGLIAGLFGLVLSMFGVDPVVGAPRFTFNNVNLMAGINTIPALIGFFSIPQILKACTDKPKKFDVKIRTRDFVPSLKELWEHKATIFRSSIIGVIIGMIPATGGNIAAFISYDQTKRFSKDRANLGKGSVEGVIASEAANNGVAGGALVPMLTLGIPGDSITAVMLGGLMLHGVTPGPKIFVEHADVVYSIFVCVLLATIMMVAVQCVGIRGFVQVLRVSPSYLSPILAVLSLIGAYALRKSFFDVIVALILGIVGYLMTKAEFPMAPAVLGLVLGSIFEGEFRRAMSVTRGDWTSFFTRPVSCVIIVITLIVLLVNIYNNIRDRKRGKQREGEAMD